jgi:glycosyltransferase involved in cell wall biosynthesis
MKVLWVSLRIFSSLKEKQSAVWLKALAESLISLYDIQLYNISSSSSGNFEECDYYGIKQFSIPIKQLDRFGEIDFKAREKFIQVVNDISPDIIQVWGTENPFGVLPFSNRLAGIKFLTVQGVLSSMGPCNLRGFTLKEILSTLGVREMLTGNKSIIGITRSFFEDEERENKIIQMSDYILNQSEWTDAQILAVNPKAKLFRTERVLRSEFTCAKKWNEFIRNDERPVIYTSSLGYSWKGLHSLLKAAKVLKLYQPNFELRIAGRYGRTDWLGDGYLRFLRKYIQSNNLQENITWLGAIDAFQIVDELQNAHVYVNPSFVESYSNAFAEAMIIGTPSVVSFAGAVPELADNNKEAVFYTPGDFRRCAYLMNKLIKKKSLSLELSQNSIRRAERRNNTVAIARNQYQIYQQLLGMKKYNCGSI